MKSSPIDLLLRVQVKMQPRQPLLLFTNGFHLIESNVLTESLQLSVVEVVQKLQQASLHLSNVGNVCLKRVCLFRLVSTWP